MDKAGLGEGKEAKDAAADKTDEHRDDGGSDDLDFNHDGKVSKEEAAVDQDGDGTVSKEEREQVDVDGDGQVTEAELHSVQASLVEKASAKASAKALEMKLKAKEAVSAHGRSILAKSRRKTQGTLIRSIKQLDGDELKRQKKGGNPMSTRGTETTVDDITSLCGAAARRRGGHRRTYCRT